MLPADGLGIPSGSVTEILSVIELPASTLKAVPLELQIGVSSIGLTVMLMVNEWISPHTSVAVMTKLSLPL